jgi:hypothetical protein
MDENTARRLVAVGAALSAVAHAVAPRTLLDAAAWGYAVVLRVELDPQYDGVAPRDGVQKRPRRDGVGDRAQGRTDGRCSSHRGLVHVSRPGWGRRKRGEPVGVAGGRGLDDWRGHSIVRVVCFS